MVSINYATREVCCKIVYYGPGLSGKTTNLQVVHQKVPQNTRGKLISLATEADRTLYFDFLPINIGSINGFAAKFQLYTVPGQVYYNATRKLVLRGVDGVVFVADSQADKHDDNMESLSNLKENLVEYGYDADELPIVIQYNKADLPSALSQEELDEKLNDHNWPSYTAAAVDGVGVFDTLKAIMKLVLEKAKKGGSSSKPKVSPGTARVEPQLSVDAQSPQASPSSQSPQSSSVDAQGASYEAPATAEPALAAAHSAGESGGVETHPAVATAESQVGVADTPQKSSPAATGGLFGAPRSSSGRTRRAPIGTGRVSAPAGGSAGDPASTGEIENVPSAIGRENTQPVRIENEHSGGGESSVQHGASQSKSQSKSQQIDKAAGSMGHDPLEQAPPQMKQKKPGFFRRLFGWK